MEQVPEAIPQDERFRILPDLLPYFMLQKGQTVSEKNSTQNPAVGLADIRSA